MSAFKRSQQPEDGGERDITLGWLSMRIIDSSGTFDDGITFFIDAAGTGACL